MTTTFTTAARTASAAANGFAFAGNVAAVGVVGNIGGAGISA